MRKNKHEKGQALIVIALAAIILFGFAALSIDGSVVFSDKRHAQNAADTSAMAAALAKTRGNDLFTAGQTRSTSNGYDNNRTSNFVEITTTPTPDGACTDTGVDIKVKITSYVKTTFARILGWTQLTNVVTATARACDISGGKPFYSGSSVWSTQTSAVVCNGTSSQSVHNGGSGNVNLYGGGLGSSDPGDKCIDLNGGTTQLLKNDDGTCATITTVGLSAPYLGGVTGTNCPTTPILNVPLKTPPADLGITCSGTGTVSGNTASPGTYGNFPPSSNITLNPGTYCVTGNFSMNGGDTLKGTGVTIVMKYGTLKWSGNSTVQITAPTSGDYKGLLIYYPPSNTNDLSMEGTGDNTFSGTVLAQNSHCKYAGTSDVNKQPIQFICGSWETTGTADLNIVYNASLFYSPTTPPKISLLQ
jgi:hypothetical protein